MADHTRLLKEMAEEYSRYSPTSEKLHTRAKSSMVDGGSHALRLNKPFPPRIISANGAKLTDADRHVIIDFWQGHFGNILGHNPAVITDSLQNYFAGGSGLQTGFADELQIEAAEVLCQQTGSERARFTTSGSLATMYAIMLARSFTGRELVMKISGGWHGGHPWGLKGVKFDAGPGYDHLEGEGFPQVIGEQVVQTRFNDTQMLADHFKQYGERLACVIMEPVAGNGGFIPGTREYLQTARKLADQYGVVLIFDEVIAGFRFRAGNVGKLYGVQPDLATFGKIIGGGMPVAAVGGRKDVMEMAGSSTSQRVRFSGGTYSGHPSSMLAAKTMMNYLVQNETKLYPRLASLGKLARERFTQALASEGVHTMSTGFNKDLPDSSLFILHFPSQAGHQITCPEDANDPSLCDTVLRKEVVKLGLLLQDVNMTEGKGAVSYAHTEEDLDKVSNACGILAARIKKSL
jgi:glutamate-1-semialdehyde 2,1-aminomutase